MIFNSYSSSLNLKEYKIESAYAGILPESTSQVQRLWFNDFLLPFPLIKLKYMNEVWHFNFFLRMGAFMAFTTCLVQDKN
jgi:hypothetical protein